MTKQNKELFKEFIDFCASQPKDKQIDHCFWEACAVGEFSRHKEFKPINRSELVQWREELLGEFEGRLYKKIDCRKCPDTYGPFTEFLKEYL